MPNCEYTNYLLHGKSENLKKFVKTVNEAPDLTNGKEKHWIGNFFASALGLKTLEELENFCKEKDIYIRWIMRGTLEPYAHENEIAIDQNGFVKCFVDNAYCRNGLFENLLDKEFQLEFAFESVNDFDLESYIYDPQNIYRNLKSIKKFSIIGEPENIQDAEKYFKRFPKLFTKIESFPQQINIDVYAKNQFNINKFNTFLHNKLDVEIKTA